MSRDPSIRRIAIAVRNLEKAVASWRELFGAEFTTPPWAENGDVVAAEWGRGPGEPRIELVQGLSEEGDLARFIRKRGEGVHHVSLAVPDLEAAVARLLAAGARVLRTPSYYRDEGGRPLPEVFVHPKDASGILFHLVEER